MRNIFSSINRYAHRQQENFLTEGLAFLLDLFINREPDVLPDFLYLISGQHLEIDAANLVISTQESTELGRPDLVLVQKTDFTFFIEIKHDSSLGHRQLERYYEMLLERPTKKRQLVLLTRSKYSLRQSALGKEKYRHICWYEISAWLRDLKLEDEITRYIAQSYVDFLEEKSMSLTKVTKELIPGILAMHHLLNMMEIALLEVMPNESFKKTDMQDSIGFYWTEGKHWLGIYYGEPQQVWLEKGGIEKPRPKLGLNLIDVGFFDIVGGQQLEKLIAFVADGTKELGMQSLPIV